MPELPEVEDAATRLRQAVAGRTIAAVATSHPAVARTLTPAICARLVGRQVVSVARRAKIQLVTLDDGQVLEVHFRMTGDWDVGRDEDPAPPHQRVRLTMTDGTRVSLVDSRALAVVRLHEAGQLTLPSLGPEPLSADFTVDGFRHALSVRRGPIKPALLDQKLVSGVGNIYAAEALWVAGIHPTRVASSLSRARVERLRDAIREVLTTAPTGRYYTRDTTRAAAPGETGTASRDEQRAANEAWRVYGRAGEPCLRCARTIRCITQSGRSTYYCACQR